MAVIRRVQAKFHTLTDDKDRGDGISERYMLGSQILGSNTSWGKDLVFRNNAHDLGQEFDLSRFAVDHVNDCKQLHYDYEMDNNDGWHVRITIEALLDDGTRHVLAEEERKIGHNAGDWSNPKTGTLKFRCP